MREWIDRLNDRQRVAVAATAFVMLVGVAMMLFPVSTTNRAGDVACGPAITAATLGKASSASQMRREGDCGGAGQARMTAGFALLFLGAAGGAVGVTLFARTDGQRPSRSTAPSPEHSDVD